MPDDEHDDSNDDDKKQDDGKETDDDEKGDDKKGGDKKDDEKKDKKEEKKPLWPWLVGGVLLLGCIAVVLLIIFIPTAKVWTDDAYVMVHYASVAPRIAGQVTAVPVDDNDTVPASGLLVQLDDRDQRAAVATAEAMLARDQAMFREELADVGRQPSLIHQEDSRTASLDAQITLARENQARYRNLAATGAGTQQSRQSADAQLAELLAERQGAQAAAEAARHQLDVLHAMADAAKATIASDEARLRTARLQLSYTRVLAPLRGTVSERSVQVGDTLAAGQTLMSLVPLDRLYIVANYREEALRHVLPGQHVRIHVDAYNIVLNGTVQGIPPASGAIYSPIPPNNATGNFTKIVQRLPVKILVDPGQDLARLLRAGFSVETTIDTGLADVAAEQATTPARLTSGTAVPLPGASADTGAGAPPP